MAAKTTQEIIARIDTLEGQLAKYKKLLAQSQYVDLIQAGARVDVDIKKGDVIESHESVLVLGKKEAEGTSGAWFRVRINEGTIDEEVVSVRLSAITKLEGFEGDVPAEVDEADVEEVDADATGEEEETEAAV